MKRIDIYNKQDVDSALVFYNGDRLKVINLLNFNDAINDAIDHYGMTESQAYALTYANWKKLN